MPRGVSLQTYSATPSSPTQTLRAHLSLSLSASHLFTHKHCLCVTANTLSSIALSDWLSQRSENPHNGGTVVVIYDSDSEERTRCADVQSAMTDLPNIRLTYLCCLLRVPSGEGTLCLPGFKIKTPPPHRSLPSYTLPSTSLLPSSLSLLSYCTLSILCSSVYSSSIM